MEQMLRLISKEDECKETDIIIDGKLFRQFITPFVEITMAVGKIDPQKIDPLIIVTPRGAFFMAGQKLKLSLLTA